MKSDELEQAVERLRWLAQHEYLITCDHVDRHGRPEARGEALHRIRFGFTNGEVVALPPEAMPELLDVHFRLRPEGAVH